MRDRDESGRARNARPRDALGRPLPYDQPGVEPLCEDLDEDPEALVALATELLDRGMPFQAHEVLEVAWKSAPAEQRHAWQGLAQLAVALTHALRGNQIGAARLAQRGRRNAEGPLPEVAWPLRDRLLSAVEPPVEPLE